MDHRNDKMQQELRAVPRAVEQNHRYPIADVGLHPRYSIIRKFHLVSKRRLLAGQGKLIVLVLYFDTLTTELEVPQRPSRTWGALCCWAEWSTGPPLSGGMVLGKGIVRNSGADLQHAMGASWGPTHLLVGAHPTVQQPLHRALRGRRRDRLVAALCRRIIDDQVRLPGDVGLEPSQQRRCLRRGRQCRLRYALKPGQCLPDEIQGTLHLTVPEAPADVLDRIGQPRLVRALARRISGPSLGRLRHVLDAHGAMKPVQYVAGWTDACRLSERARAISAVAQDGHRRARRRAEAMQHTPQLLLLPVRLGRHAAEDDRPALVAADLGHEDLEGAHLVAAHRPHVAAVNAERDRARRGYRSGRLRGRQCHALEPGANLQSPLPRGLDRRGIPQGEERLQQRQGTSVRQRGAHGGNNALILRRATVGHDLRHRRDRPPAGDTAPAWTEAGSAHLHHPEQRDQAPGPPVLERALCPAPVATAPAAAVLIHLRRD